MNSVFLNYNTSYFDLLSNATSVLSPPYGSYNLIKSSNGKLVESNLFLESGDGYSDIKTLVPSIGFGAKSSYNIAFKNIDIGYWANGGSYYPESSLKVNIYPTTTFNQGLKFTQNPSRYNSSDLWVSSNGAMKYRDRNVVSSADGAISGNLAVFGSDTIGAVEDSGISILKGLITLTLRDNNTTPGNNSININFYYQKIGKCVNLTLKKKLFQGNLLGSPTGLSTSLSTSGFPFPEGLLPTFLQPIDEYSCPILIYQQVNGVSTDLIDQVGLLRLGGIIGNRNAGNVEIYKKPSGRSPNNKFDADSGAFDGWSSIGLTYFTA